MWYTPSKLEIFRTAKTIRSLLLDFTQDISLHKKTTALAVSFSLEYSYLKA